MAFYDKFPYTNFQELNLDKIIQALKTMQEELKDFISNNVIKYADPIQWDITRQYEANTIVADSIGNAFISSQPVPVGVALSNTDYWSQIGNFDGLFTVIKTAITPCYVPMLGSAATDAMAAGTLLWVGDELYEATAGINIGDTVAEGTNVARSSVNARFWNVITLLRGEMTTADTALSNSIGTLRTDMNNSFNTVNNTITANQNANNLRFNAIESAIGAASERYYIFIGDSFGEGWTPDGNTDPYWNQFKTMYNIPNDHLYASNVGGSAFTRGTTFLSQLQALYSVIPDRDKITDIIVMGGRNDYGQTPADIMTARNSFINYAKVNYPNAKIRIGWIGKSYERGATESMVIQFNTYLGYKTDCEINGAIYMDGIETCLTDSNVWASDNKHPNQAGQDALFNGLVSIIETNSYTYLNQIYPTLNYETGFSGPTGDISVDAIGNQTKIVFTPRDITCNFTLNANKQGVDIGSLSRMLGDGRTYDVYNATAVAVLQVNSYFYVMPVKVCLRGNMIRLIFTDVVDAHNAYLTGTVTKIQLGGFSMRYNNLRGD